MMEFPFNYAVLIVIATTIHLSISSGIARQKVLEENIKVAKEARKEFNADPEKYGLERLKSVISDEKKMSRVLQFVLFEQVCLRAKYDATSSCYALSDFSVDPSDDWKKLESWMSMPYTNKLQSSIEWYERLYNSVASILLAEGGDGVDLLLGTKGGHGVGQRKEVDDIGLGNSQTFCKGFITGDQLKPTVNLKVAESIKDMKSNVEKVLQMIETAYGE